MGYYDTDDRDCGGFGEAPARLVSELKEDGMSIKSNYFDKLAMSRRAFVGGALAAGAMSVLPACGSSDSSSSSSENTLSYYLSEPAYIDPYNGQENQGNTIIHAVFDGLLTWNYDKGVAEPLCAKDLPEVSEDGLTYTFHLREGMKFHNGDAVDAASFKRGWERMADPKMATPGEVGYHLAPIAGYAEMNSGDAKHISGIVAKDDLTLEVTLTDPMADFTAVCTLTTMAPVPQCALDDPESFLVKPIGNGPFQMAEEWKHNQYINVTKFDDYYGDKPSIDGIYFSIQKTPETAFNEFKAGNIDFCNVPLGKIKDTEKKYGTSEDGYTTTPGKQVLTGTECSVYFLVLNPEDEVLADVDVRHAMALAINRQAIVDTLFEGSRQPATSIMPKIIDDSEESTWTYCTYDPDQAKQILDAKYPAGSDGSRGLSITLNYNGDGGHEDIMSSIQSDLEAVGFTVTQQKDEWATYLKALTDGDYSVARLGWIADYPIMDNFLYPNFFSTADNNYEKYNNPEIDAAILEARKIQDEEERKAAYRKICAQIGEDMPVIPIMFYAHNYVGSERIKKMYFDPSGTADFVNMKLA